MRFKFKLRYLVMAIAVILIYQGWKKLSPVRGYRLQLNQITGDNQRKMIKECAEVYLPDSIRKFREVLTNENWVKEVKVSKGLKGNVAVRVVSRHPVGRVMGVGLVDEDGNIFNGSRYDSLPVIECRKKEYIKKALWILKNIDYLDFNKLVVTPYDVYTKSGHFRINWGNEDYRKKSRLLRKIFNSELNITSRLDLRFKGLIVLRR